jgi:hypothetical protein
MMPLNTIQPGSDTGRVNPAVLPPGAPGSFPRHMGDGKCNVSGCSCTGYTKGDSPGTCGCGHLARDHI